MSADLLEQLANYGADHRARQAPVEREEILARVRELTVADENTATAVRSVPQARRPDRRRIVASVAAATLLGTLVAGLILSNRNTATDDLTPGDEPPTTAPTTAATAPDELAAPSSGETQRTVIGDITWTLVEGDGSSQPEHVTAEIDGVFYGTDEESQTWRSSDGISWEPGEPPAEGFFDVVEIGDELWARVISDGGSELARWDGDEFVPVSLPDTVAPAVEGLQRRGPTLLDPVALGDELVVPASTDLDVPWNDLYSTTHVFPEWDAPTETIRLIDPESGDRLPLAVLTAELATADGGAVEFRDAETGDLVIAVEPIPGIDPDEFLARMIDGGILHNELYIGGPDGFEVVETPWPLTRAPRIAALDGQLLAVVEYTRRDEIGGGRQDWELWTSVDGRTWEPIDLPMPSRSRLDEIMVVSDGSLALLTIVSSDGNVQAPETWSTRDGLTWSPVEVAGAFSSIEVTDFGWIQTEFEERTGITVSPDGLTWQHIPIALGQPRGAGNGGGSVHGDTIFLTMNENGGERTMWVGRVENSVD